MFLLQRFDAVEGDSWQQEKLVRKICFINPQKVLLNLEGDTTQAGSTPEKKARKSKNWK